MSSSGPPRKVPKSIHVDDVDDAIGIAAERVNAAEDSVSIAELVDIGEQVGLPASAVVDAAARLEAHKDAIREREARRNRILLAAVAGVTLSLVVTFAIALAGRSSLVEQRAEVDAKRAQVVNVVQRRDDLLARLEGVTLPDEDRWAEVAGSENRIAVEKRRYDEAAVEYNRRAATFSGLLGASIFGHPTHVELSTQIAKW